MSIDKLNLTNDEKIIFVNAINELSGRIRERESEIQALKVAVDLLRKQEGAEPYYGLIPSLCAERSTPDSAPAAQQEVSSGEERDGAAIVREYVEHDLDDHYEDGGLTELVIPLPPTGLIERIDDALRVARSTRARISVAEGED